MEALIKFLLDPKTRKAMGSGYKTYRQLVADGYTIDQFLAVLQPEILEELIKLVLIIGNAVEDGELSAKERSDMMKQLWKLVRIYRGK